ncbi:ribose 5-phosphate isomerase A, partial [Oenococcus oeni]
MEKNLQNELKKEAAIRAAEFVENDTVVGLGTGSTVKFLVDELGRKVREENLSFTGVTTSKRTASQAESLGIKIVSLDSIPRIDLTIDGADQVDNNFNGIKGGGAALLWE